MLADQIKQTLRDVPDFPKPGIIFKDITPLLKDAALCRQVVAELAVQVEHLDVEAVAGIESRGFLFGMLLAQALEVPFVPIRKKGKLPYKTISESYALEYGEATLEIHEDAFLPGQRVLVHDDLLATGGTVIAAANLVKHLKAELVGFSFIISLDFLGGKNRLLRFASHITTLVRY